MATSKRQPFFTVIAVLILLFELGFAQRPTTASVCDYYAQARFGANTSETQLKFIQSVVSLAFEGGSRLNNVSSELTGILRPGKFNDVTIDLHQYFNGSRASTNVNNAPIGINWLDQGGTAPLADFLDGKSATPALANTSNQYHLFGNFFVAFGRAFGCTIPPPSLPNTNGPISLAYAHKFMNLDYNQLSYFIKQLSIAAIHFGVSPQDADTFRTSLNSRFNVRCAPAVSSNPSSPPQLLSLCQNPTCPLAVPVSDCAAYANLTANGVANSSPTSVVLSASKTAASSSTGEPTSSTATAASSSSEKLSTGGIAGVAVGGAAVLLIAVIAIFYFLRKRKPASAAAPEPAPAAAWNQQNYGSPMSHPSSTYTPKNPHVSYLSTGEPPSEMDTSRYQSPVGSPDSGAHHGYGPRSSAHASEIWRPAPVEMDGTLPVGVMRGPSPPPQNAPWSNWQQQGDGMPVQGQGYHAEQQWSRTN